MNEIVFEEKNKDYGAFLLRKSYRIRLLKALCLTLGIFILSVLSPAIAKHLGLFSEKEEEVLDMTIYVLHAPPSINPLQPPKPPPPKLDEVKRPTEKFMEMEAADKKDIEEPPPPTIEELDKKDISKVKSDAPPVNDPPLVPEDLGSGGGAGDGKIWNRVEQPPEFTGGEDAYSQFMYENMQYPEEAKDEGIEGVTRLYFIVAQDGTIENVKVIKSSGNTHLDAEAMRLLKLQPKYKPGRQNGKAVKVSCITDIEFKLD